MMRSLWTAASGMKAQQTSLDTISNNLSNINTTGYKRETTEFRSLLYQSIQEETTDTNGQQKPIGAQVGLGVKVAAIGTSFKQGNMLHTEGQFDFAIEGNGFFMKYIIYTKRKLPACSKCSRWSFTLYIRRKCCIGFDRKSYHFRCKHKHK